MSSTERFLEIPFVEAGDLVLDAFVDGDVLNIPKYYWNKINAEFDPEYIRYMIVYTVEERRLPVPNPHVTLSKTEALLDFARLCGKDSTEAIRYRGQDFVSRHDYWYSLGDHYLSGGNSGLGASGYFHSANRMRCGHVRFRSPEEVWTTPERLEMVLKALWSLKCEKVGPIELYVVLALRSYVASQFKPAAAKAMYELFGAHSVYDPSSGWGDRFAGFSAAKNTELYVGTDPNLNLSDGYWEQGEAYDTGKEYEFHTEPAEDIDLSPYKFDFVFTSPPYFGTEKYSNHRKQSWKRYGDVDKWMTKFLFPMLDESWNSLVNGGVVAINIADLGVSFAGGELICDAMNDHIGELRGAYYAGAMPLRLSSRPQTGLEKDGGKTMNKFVEPIWVWSKGRDKSVSDFVRSFRSTGGRLL